jgi:hypothetical protein
VKKSRGKPRAKALHAPCKELAEALRMPARKRRGATNRRRRKETGNAYVKSYLAGLHGSSSRMS